MFASCSEFNPSAVVCNGLSKQEIEFLQFVLRTNGQELLFWDNLYGSPYLENHQVIFQDSFKTYSIKTLKDWAVEITVVGRLTMDERKFLFDNNIVSFWNLEKYPIQLLASFMLRRFVSDLKPICLMWTGDEKFNEMLSYILRSFSIDSIRSTKAEFALSALKENSYDFLVIDWDYGGIDTTKLIRELRILKTEINNFPISIGIKDFDKMDIFKDLSNGIKEFCSVLFSKKEVIELFLRSIPLSSKELFSKEAREVPLLFLGKTNTGKNALILDYERENQMSRMNAIQSSNQIDSIIFKRQFEWLSEFI
jgi:hypothetical protein